jgi:hypothetical protein
MPEDKEQILLEPWFLLSYYTGMPLTEYLKLPIAYRDWYIRRISKEIQKANDQGSDIPSKAAHHNPPDVRAMTGKFRQTSSNPRTQRFT